CSSFWPRETQAPEQFTYLTEGAGCSTSWSSTTRIGAATVWPSTKRLNECTGFRGSRSGRGCSTEGANRERRTDRHPDPVSFARVLNSGYQKAGRKEEPSWRTGNTQLPPTWRTTGSCSSTGAPTSSKRSGRTPKAAAITTFGRRLES